MIDHTRAGDRWIPDTEYKYICSKVPILCVDLLPLISTSGKFGLIERDTYDGKRGLNLVGGGVLIDETIHEALERHLLVTLGDQIQLCTDSLTLVGVYQYFRDMRPGQLHDPRKNAVSLTYTGAVEGEANSAGEAHAFHLFDIDAPPKLDEYGFGQGKVVYDALETLHVKNRTRAIDDC